MGLEITKVHRGIKFEERPWLAEYIGKNTALRKEATTKSGKDIPKRMNNSVFGKTMENQREHVNST